MLRDAPADGPAVEAARGRGRGRGRHRKRRQGPRGGSGPHMTPHGRPCCLRPRTVVDGHERVCASCGTVHEERLPDAGPAPGERAESGLLAARVRVDNEGAVGTRDISPPSVLRSRRHRRMLEGARDPFDAMLQRACGMLSLPPACCRRAAHVARAVRGRCAGGATLRRACVAYFAIYRTCAEYGIGADEADMAAAVRAAFAVRRTFRPRRAVFAVEAVLVESGGIGECIGDGRPPGGGECAGDGGRVGGATRLSCAAAEDTAADTAADEGAYSAHLGRIASEPLRRSALRLCDSGAPIAVAVEIARRLELIGAGAPAFAGRAAVAAAAVAV